MSVELVGADGRALRARRNTPSCSGRSGAAAAISGSRRRSKTYAALQPFVGSGRYVNYLDDDEPGDAAAAAYGPNYRRLCEIKTKYDPENFFHMNQNIRPL